MPISWADNGFGGACGHQAAQFRDGARAEEVLPVLRRRAGGESVESIHPDLIPPHRQAQREEPEPGGFAALHTGS